MQLLRQTGWMIVRQLRNLMREPIWIALMVIQPLIWLLLYGQLFSRVGALRGGASSYIEFLTPGIICMNAFFGGSWSGMAMIDDLDRHVIDRFLAAPASRFALILSQVVRAGIIAMIQALILLLVGLALGVRIHGGALGWLVVFAAAALLAMTFAGFSHGIALIVRQEASMIAAANFVGLPLMFLSAILIPQRRCRTGSSRSRASTRSTGACTPRATRSSPAATGARAASTSCSCSRPAPSRHSFATWCFRSYQRSI